MTTYATLKSDIAGWLLRDDLTAAIPSFVRLAEAAIRRDVRVRNMLKTSTLTLSDQSVALPSDFLEMQRIVLNSGVEWEIHYQPPSALYRNAMYWEAAGTPSYYTIEGEYLVFAPGPASSPEALISYYRKYDALSADSDSNWLLANHYDLYLYGALSHSAPYIKDDERVALWSQGYSSALNGLTKSDRRSTFAGGPLAVHGSVGP